MKRKIKKLIILTCLVTMMLLILIYPNDSINTILYGSNLFIKNIFPSLFPFFIITDLLSEYNFINILSKYTKRLTKLLGITPNASFAFFLSMMSGFPSGAKLTNELLEKKKISLDMAERLITFTHFSNPIFIIGTIGTLMLKNKRIAIIILISHFLGNFFIAIMTKKKIKEEITSFEKTSKKNFINILNDSIYKTFNTLMLLLGVIITFLLIVNFINKIFNPNLFFKILINGVLEMTSGIKLVSETNLNIITKGLIITNFLSFGGLSIHLQVFSILEKTKIKYKTYLKARVLHSIISSIIYLLLIMTL